MALLITLLKTGVKENGLFRRILVQEIFFPFSFDTYNQNAALS